MGVRIEVLTEGSVDFSSDGVMSLLPVKAYNINDNSLTPEEIREIQGLLADNIVDSSAVNSSVLTDMIKDIPQPASIVEISPQPGVNNPEGKEAKRAIEDILGRKIGDVSLSKQLLFRGELTEEKFGENYIWLQKQLGNPKIDEFRFVPVAEFDPVKGIGFHFPVVDLPKVPAFEYSFLPADPDNPHPEEEKRFMELSDQALAVASDRLEWSLSVEEMKTIQRQFQNEDFIAYRKSKGLEAHPTDAEMANLAQSWSEHCKHKKFTGKWFYTSDDPNDESGLPEIVDNPLKTIIMASAQKILKKKDWVVSVFEDNAGVIKLNSRINLAHKVETHNSPSGIDGFGGANTGTGGVLRDPEHTGQSMEPVSSQFGFRTPHPDSLQDLPPDIQSPSRMLETVILGVEDYGNKMGIPTMCGAGPVFIDDGWLKPGIPVGCVAVAPAEINGRPTHVKNIKPEYIAISLGGRVGKDGIGGAVVSSRELKAGDEQKHSVNQHVQIGDPLVEKEYFEVMHIIHRLGYIEASQDCGAGGWNSAVGELADLLHDLEKKRYALQNTFREKSITKESPLEKRLETAASVIDLKKLASPFIDQLKLEISSGEIFDLETNGRGGVVMDLTHAPEKYAGLRGWEKLVSEAQERGVVVVKKENLERVRAICQHLGVEMTEIAHFNNSGYYEVIDQEKPIVCLPLDFMHQGLPQMEIKAHWTPCQNQEPDLPLSEDLTADFLRLLGQPNLQNYNWINERYDHEVQGGSRLKPIVGRGRGRSDAIAYKPVLSDPEVVIESWGSNPWQSDIDAYHMGRNNVVDAVGRIIAAGGTLDRITYNGNTLCPSPEKDPHTAAQVIRMLKGAADMEETFDTPTISGKDSTSLQRKYRSTKTGEEVTLRAKSELLKSPIGIIPGDSTVTSPDFKLPGDLIYIVGETRDEAGASEWYLMNGVTGKNIPKSNADELISRYRALESAVRERLVHSAQYLGKGALAKALSNCAVAGDWGVDITLDEIDQNLPGRPDQIFLGSESTGRILVSVHSSKSKEFEEKMKGCYCRQIGQVRRDKKFNIDYQGKLVIQTDLDAIKEANKGTIYF